MAESSAQAHVQRWCQVFLEASEAVGGASGKAGVAFIGAIHSYLEASPLAVSLRDREERG